jgi:serine/threonine protein kinase
VLGPVYRAIHPDDERVVAIKVFRLDVPPERVHQFVAELEKLIAANLAHPGIAAPIAAGIASVSAYLVQEFAEADSLDVVVRDYGPAPPPDAVRIVTELAGALDFAAVVNVTHGMLHPRDVLIAAEDVRLTGLGIGQALERIGARTRRPNGCRDDVGIATRTCSAWRRSCSSSCSGVASPAPVIKPARP